MTGATTPDSPAPPGAAVPTPAPVPNEREVIARLSALKPPDYDRVRKDEAKALGIQVKTLDDMVRGSRGEDRIAGRLPFVEHEPADEPVNPEQVLNAVTAVILQFLVLDVEQAHAAALWAAHTHLIDVAEVSPLAIINAPERACAKTLFQTILGRFCQRSMPAANASLSALFRAIESWRPTLFIDEADTFFRENAELHGMVNAGYKRGGYVLRSEATGDSFEPKMFSVYSAKSIAGIALERHLPDSTMSRGIVFSMRRKLPHETVERMRNADDTLFDRLGSQLARFAADYAHQIRKCRPVLPDALSDRAQDNWEPLLAIAECAGPVWLERARTAALKLSCASESVGSTGNELLADIQDIFDSRSKSKISTVELLDKLTEDPEKSWATYNRGRPLTPRQLAKQLDVYGIKPKTVRLERKSTPKGYERAQFDDAFARYLKLPEPGVPQAAGPPPGDADTPQRHTPPEPSAPTGTTPDPGRCGVADTCTPPDVTDLLDPY